MKQMRSMRNDPESPSPPTKAAPEGEEELPIY